MPTPVLVVMPQMGESLSEGTVIKWHKKVGDRVERDEPLFEISTDKVDTEVPSPVGGVLRSILVGEGETVPVGTTVAEIGDSLAATSPSPEPPRPREEPQPKASAPEAPPSAAAPSQGHFRSSHEPTTFRRRGSEPEPAPAPPPPSATSTTPSTGTTGGRPKLSPAVLSLAAEHRLPIEELVTIPGTGAFGRISRRDVERYLENRKPPTTMAIAAPSSPAGSPGSMVARETPPQYLYQPEPDDRLVPMSPMRKQIAEHMLWSQQISAQVTSFTECNMHRIVRYRDEKRDEFEEREGVPLTFLPFVAEATVRAIRDFPIFNASVVGDQVALKKHVHLGIAVALEGGLIVPVVKDADGMSFVGLARAIHRMADQARSRTLEPADVRGATFTITNPGMFGGLTGTPMIAQPQVAILGLGAVAKKPVVIDDAIAIRPIMVMALTFDHRIIDGVTGFQFLERIRLDLENFDPPS